MRTLVLIPARMASTRLPGKPLADIHGVPMIVHVLRRGQEAALGPVVVACAEAEVADAVRAHGGRAVLTDPDLPSGSDRIHAALAEIDPKGEHDVVVNLQGDLPTIAPAVLRAVLAPLADPAGAACDIATLVAEIDDPGEVLNPSVVKAVVALRPGDAWGPALYFSRTPVPSGPGPLFHHIGVYAYRRGALERFVAAPPGVLEGRERLEQLRALETGLRLAAARVDSVPPGVDTPADLAAARRLLAPAAP